MFFNTDYHPLYIEDTKGIITPECNYNGYQVLFGYDEDTQKQEIKVFKQGTCDLLLQVQCYDSHGDVIDHYYVTALCSIVIDLYNLKVYSLDISDSNMFQKLLNNELSVERLIELYQDVQ